MSQDPEPGWRGTDGEVRTGLAAFETHLGDLVAYCHAFTGRDEDAISTAHGVVESARSLLNDPGQLRAWLFALARMEILAGSPPQAREIWDLVHEHGIRPEDLPTVLGISPVEADEKLAAAEEEIGWDYPAGREDAAYLNGRLPDPPAAVAGGDVLDLQLPSVVAYCSGLTGREDAVSAAHEILGSARSLLSDPHRVLAWLVGNARRELAGDAAPGPREMLDLVHLHGIRAEDLPIVLGIAPIEADALLAAAEEEYASGALRSADSAADSRDSEGWNDDNSRADDSNWAEESSWDDRAATWTGSAAAVSDDVGWEEGAGWDDGAGWHDPRAPTSHRLQDIDDLFRKPTEPTGRHAASGPAVGGLRGLLARGPVRVVAATGIVVAVIGVGAVYMAEADSPPPSQAAHQASHRTAAVTPSAGTTSGPAPTATPTPSTSQPVPVAAPPAAAPTSPTATSSSPKPARSSPPTTSPPTTPSPPTTSPPSPPTTPSPPTSSSPPSSRH
jgi:hypothetical protein